MDEEKVNSNQNPRETANIFSLITWAWTLKLFKKGYTKILGIEDLYDPLKIDRSNLLGDRLEKQWFVEQERAKRRKRDPCLFWTIFRTFAPEMCLLVFIQFFNEIFIRLGTPFLLGILLEYFKQESKTPFETAIYYAVGMMVTNLVTLVLQNQAIFLGYHTGGRVKIAACSLVYRKVLRLNKTVLDDSTAGKIVNLLAGDVNRFDFVFYLAHYLWIAPVSAIIVMVLLYLEVGWSAFIGMGLFLLVAIFQAYLGRLISHYRLEIALKTDERLHLMNEIIRGMQVIKIYAWEKPFSSLVKLARHVELKFIRKNFYIRSIFMTFYLITGRMAVYVTLITMLLREQEITSEKVYVYISYFNVIALTMTDMFANSISELSEASITIKRLQQFLMFDEFQSKEIGLSSFESGCITMSSSVENGKQKFYEISTPSFVTQNDKIVTNKFDEKNYFDENKIMSDDKSCSVKLKHVTAVWNLNATKCTLDDINVELEKGKLYILIGTVGSGKSSFISAILGELKILKGSVEVNGSFSYADQDGWVFGSSIRQNILFGQKFDEQRYAEVVDVCALQNDFFQFSCGDKTMIDERGTVLSGAQRARINLARAVYRQADIYLLEDPLSAADAHVRKHLFEECIQKYLFGKTRILATHQLQYIKNADAILFLDQGKLRKYSNYQEFVHMYPDYNTLIQEEKEVISETISNVDSERRLSLSSISSQVSEYESETDEEVNDNEEAEQVDFYENTSRGTVKGSLFLRYVRSAQSWFSAVMVLILYVATQACVSLNDYFVPLLIEAEASRNRYSEAYKNASLASIDNVGDKYLDEKDHWSSLLPRDYYWYIYTALVASVLLVGLLRSFTFFNMCLRASKCIHDRMATALIHTAMKFFYTNASGRILNRFSKDLNCVDVLLPKVIVDASQAICLMLGAVIVMATVNYWILLPFVLIGCFFYCIRMIYLRTSRDMKRLEGITRSPVFTHLNATLNGIMTVRACQTEKILTEEFDNLQDTHTSSWYMLTATSLAFGFFMDLCCFIFFAILIITFLLLKDNFTGGSVGLVLTQMMSLTGMLQCGIRQSAELTNHLISFERVIEYAKLLVEPTLRDQDTVIEKKEPKNVHQGKILLIEPPEDWPEKGRIEFRNISLRYYDEGPRVIKNLHVMIRPGLKVGIVGRTAAGKSSIISALFRFAKLEGRIDIDGLNTGNMALEYLRERISVIPQNPILFFGTIRCNLDPLNQFSDERLWQVLEEIGLKDSVQSSGNGLDCPVLDGGSNYSTGQRQLICLARAILRSNQILLMDEATAHIDPHTDALIQHQIRTKFTECTVLTITHRLNTIIDNDRILVMDKGRLVQYNHPHVLLQDEEGLFLTLAKETGAAMYSQLKKNARDAFISQNVQNTNIPANFHHFHI